MQSTTELLGQKSDRPRDVFPSLVPPRSPRTPVPGSLEPVSPWVAIPCKGLIFVALNGRTK